MPSNPGRSSLRHRRDVAARASSGQTLVLVALTMFVMMGMVGLGIDGGRGYWERRKAQNAADHAALAAAWAECNSGSPVAAGLASAATNGYNDNGVSNWVDVTSPGAGKWQATVRSTIDTTFAAAIGISTVTAETTAVASCEMGGGSGMTIWGGGDNCTNAAGKPAIKVNGSTSKVFGGMHSNSDIGVSGSSNQFTNGPGAPDDPVTYVGTYLQSGSTNTFQFGYPKDIGPSVPSPAWPAGWAPSDANATLFDAYRAVAQTPGLGVYSTNKITSITVDGVYYTTSADGIDVGSMTGGIRNVVLVAPNGPIKISVSDKELNAFVHPDLPRQDLLMVSGKTYTGTAKCDTFTIDVSGSSTDWNGVMWAPGGLIKMGGSSGATMDGAVVAWAVELNGSDLTLQYDPNLSSGEPKVSLLE
jgi:Flp pilus assembly protein TadG